MVFLTIFDVPGLCRDHQTSLLFSAFMQISFANIRMNFRLPSRRAARFRQKFPFRSLAWITAFSLASQFGFIKLLDSAWNTAGFPLKQADQGNQTPDCCCWSSSSVRLAPTLIRLLTNVLISLSAPSYGRVHRGLTDVVSFVSFSLLTMILLWNILMRVNFEEFMEHLSFFGCYAINAANCMRVYMSIAPTSSPHFSLVLVLVSKVLISRMPLYTSSRKAKVAMSQQQKN